MRGHAVCVGVWWSRTYKDGRRLPISATLSQLATPQHIHSKLEESPQRVGHDLILFVKLPLAVLRHDGSLRQAWCTRAA